MRAFILAASLALASCATFTSAARTTTNAVADVANAGGQSMLASYCAAQARAIGREGRRVDGHCVVSGARAGTAPTEAEAVALVSVREAWAPVLRAYDDAAAAHDAVRAALDATDDATRGRLLPALGHLAESYAALRVAARAVGVTLPALPTIGGAR